MGTCPHTLNRDSLTQTGPIDCVPANLKQYGTCTIMRKNGWAFLELSWKSSASGSWESGNIGTIPVGTVLHETFDFSLPSRTQSTINGSRWMLTAPCHIPMPEGAQDNSPFALYASWPLP